ncbi:MAG: SprT family zinc-dependent metalloprotease [Henriciella sp.]|nr:SprT family zinc-dependent metalloprotease [Henriciella sp.]
MIIDKGDKMALTTKCGQAVKVRLEINPKARRLILRLDRRTNEFVAVAPSKHSLPEAAAFAEERVDWMAAQLSEMPDLRRVAEGGVLPIRGVAVEISLDGPGRRAVLETHGSAPRLRVPGAPETVGKRVTRFLKAEALRDLNASVQTYCALLGVRMRRIAVKDTRSRWGSCTSEGVLSFSWRLIMAPPRVLNYVAAHECAHLLEMNHSRAFWSHVETCHPDWKTDRAWLRQNGAELHAFRF